MQDRERKREKLKLIIYPLLEQIQQTQSQLPRSAWELDVGQMDILIQKYNISCWEFSFNPQCLVLNLYLPNLKPDSPLKHIDIQTVAPAHQFHGKQQL